MESQNKTEQTTKRKITLQEVKDKNIKWFTPENKRFFGDISYSVFNDNEGNIFLIQLTYMWSDMFNGIKKKCYRIHKIDKDTLKIGELYDEIFKSLDEVKQFLK